MGPWLSRALRCHCLEGMDFCLALAHLTLIQQTSGVNVGGESGRRIGDGTTDPSACSDLKGREVGIRSAEPHDILAPACGDKPEIPKQNLGPITAFKRLNGRLVSKNWRLKLMCWFSAEHANEIEDAKAGPRLGIKKRHWDR